MTLFRVIGSEYEDTVTIVAGNGLLASAISVVKSGIPNLIAKLQEVANMPSIPALQAQLQRVQDIAHERGLECDRLTFERDELRIILGKYGKPVPSLNERKVIALERIADRLCDHLFVSVDK